MHSTCVCISAASAVVAAPPVPFIQRSALTRCYNLVQLYHIEATEDLGCPVSLPAHPAYTASMASTTAHAPFSLSLVSTDVMTSILTHLLPSELVAFFPCSHLTATFQSNERLWSSLLSSIYTLQRPFDASSTAPLPRLPEQTHRALFCHQYTRFPPRYYAHFPTIFSLYLRLLHFLRTSAQPILPSLRPGASQDDVREAESLARPGHQLPLDWLTFMKLTDGQSLVQRDNRLTYFNGLFGTVRYYGTIANFRLRSLVSAMREAKSIIGEGGLLHWVVPITSSVAGELFQTGLMTVEDRMRFYVDQHGRVVRQVGQTAHFHVVAQSFTDFLRVYVDRLEQGVYCVSGGWERGSGGISRFAFPDPCGSDCVTRGVRVQVSVLFVPEDCRRFRGEQQWLFTYRVRITHTGEGNFRGQLTNRHWIITDDRGKQDDVQGSGVIGLYPYVEPGCDEFQYESCCPLATPRGTMRGKFEFQVEGSNEVVDIVVAPFTFDIERNLT